MTSIFHKFIQVAACKPAQASHLAEFQYMQQDIRKSYKQLKDNKGAMKPSQQFIDYWKQIGKQGREDQVALYFRWIELLQKAIKYPILRDFQDRQAKLYIKKSMISKWQLKQVKLSRLTLIIFSKNLKQYPLKCYGIRKSKNKQHFSLVLQVIMQIHDSKFKSFHIGTNNIGQYQDWYRDLQTRIDIARMNYFKEIIGDTKSQNQKSQFVTIKEDTIKKQIRQMNMKKSVLIERNEKGKTKTLTQLVIDKQLKEIQDFQELDVIEQGQNHDVRQEQIHPNIFNKLFPSYNIQNFHENPVNGILIQCEKMHRLYEVEGKIKMFLTIHHNISMVFRVISESHKAWNTQIDVFTIKNKISTQNSVLIYQKDKSKGFLYRQRDYLYLKHCFSIQPIQSRQRIFMVEKSIDSIHTPPFMTVARGEKELIWSLIGDNQQKQCTLIVEGLIKGGGYMNSNQDQESTLKFFKKLLILQSYIKQIEFTKILQINLMFRQVWYVNIKPEQQEQFYSPRQIGSDTDHAETFSKQSQNTTKEIKNQQLIQQDIIKDQKYSQFIKYTSQQNIEVFNLKKEDKAVEIKHNFSSQDLSQDYIPPKFNEDRTIIIPQEYLKVKHRMEPKPKGKQRKANSIRGHHLWKGQWAVSQNAGGLLYVDQQKMREQKKVLTFIIKRIGRNILSGKGILNISLPVDIFCRQSNIERLSNSFGYCPVFLEKVSNANDPVEQLKALLSSSFGSSLIYLTMDKPFNPILGETYQAWIDGCPVYFQQISHHPPIASYLMKGRGYTISGSVQAKMDLSINSGTGCNEGIFTVSFENGRIFYFTTPPGQLVGLTYGERKLSFVDKTYFWCIQEGLFLQLTYNPLSKQRGFFFGGGGKNLVGQERLADYCEGILNKYKPDDLKQFLIPKKNDFRKIMAIPKSSPTCEIIGQLGKVSGRWTKYVNYNEEKLFNVDTDVYYKSFDQKYPLPSHSNFREDVVYRRLNNFILSQQFKEVLEIKQRRDRKLKETHHKKSR